MSRTGRPARQRTADGPLARFLSGLRPVQVKLGPDGCAVLRVVADAAGGRPPPPHGAASR